MSSKQTQAVIEIGSTGIRLMVAELLDGDSSGDNPGSGRLNILDRSEQPVNIGRDVFTIGSVTRDTLSICLQILLRYSEQLLSWGIDSSDVTVIGTSAVRTAHNRDSFVDRIKIKTGFTVKVIDGIEENRLMYIAVNNCLKDDVMRQTNSIILEISGASTEMMLMEKGQMVCAHSIRLGTVIVDQEIYSVRGSIDEEDRTEDAKRWLEEFIRNTKGTLSTEINLAEIRQFIAVCSDMRIVSLYCGKSVSPCLREILREDFDSLVENIQKHLPLIENRYNLNYTDSQSFQIALLAYKHFIDLTGVKSIIVPETSIREGLLLSLMAPGVELENEFNAQIIAGGMNLLKKYQGDESHAKSVHDISLKIFDSLKNELGLDNRARVLLELSALLHDIGMFISAENHNFHSRYIIMNSELFGLSSQDKNIVALVAAYHKGSRMPQEDSEIQLLPRNQRLIILKLTAILRVADALDRSHKQKFSDLRIYFTKDTVNFRVRKQTSLSLEKLALQEKGGLFENVFGYKIVLS